MRFRARSITLLSLVTLTLVGSWASLKAALDAAPTGGVILADSPPSVPCTSPPCTYDPASYSSARFQFSTTDSSFNSMNMGEALAVGDFNGDTFQDIAMAAPKGSSSKGIVFIVYGTSAAPASTFDVSNSSVIRMQGKTSGDLVGSALAAGDITGDGKTDLIVGAPGVNKVYIIPGATTTWTSQTGTNGIENHAGLITLSVPASTEFGFSLAIGDVGAAIGTSGTVDGKLDLLIGAPATSSSKGAAYLAYGPITTSISSLGSASNVFTFNGGTNGDRAGATVAIFASVTESTTQASMPDIGIGAPDANSTGGKLYLIEGRARDYLLMAYSSSTSGSLDTSIYRKRIIIGDLTESSVTKGALGFAISGIGDVNDDSLNDIAIGVPYAPSPIGNIEAGRVYILLGNATVLDSGSSNLSTLSAPYFYGESNYDQIGSCLSILGNVDGDARDDFLIGARRLDVSSSNDFGGAYVMLGRSTGDWGFATKKIDGVRFTFPRTSDSNSNSGTATSYRGLVVMGTPDFDADGYGDFLLGAPGSDVSTADNKGRVYYISYGDFMDRDSDTQNRASGDCDDLELARRYRSDGTETCDSKDNDCDGLVDDADSSLQGTAYYPDNDNDGFGNKNSSATQACSKPSGKVTNNTDCDDTKSAVNPNASEICDSIDNDCDIQIDDDDPSVSGRATWYRDADNDLYGTTSTTVAACNKPSGYVATSGDCLDTDSTINPAAQEICNSKDDDCDGLQDDGDPSTTGKKTYYLDADSDGYGRSDVTHQTCGSAPSGYTASNTDCNDLNPAIYPGATETCNSIDDNCDGKIDAADPAVTGTSNYYPDSDKDGYGSSSATAEKACPTSVPSGKVTSNNDCNDSDATVNPGATEICNSNKDDDCDGLKDDADPSISGQSTWYQDADADSYGNASKSTKLCTQPPGYVANNTDCNDTNPAIKPGAQEICDNGVDNDCDTLSDDADPSINDGPISVTKLVTYYKDGDDDGYGSDTVTTQKCSQPSGYSSQKGDCNDSNNSVFPGAPEGTTISAELNCLNGDSIDNDCDGIKDEGTCEYDDDGDGQTERNGDCNDANPTIYTGAAEVCNGVDEDCDQNIDEDYDDDSDGYLDEALCTGVVLPNATDCDDKDPNVYEGATVLCDGKDTDCDGTPTDTGYSSEADSDKDGQRACAGDCDDKDPVIYLDAPEFCDSKDNNCNGTVDEVIDDDNDGSTQCDDCDDNDATTNPSASEICDGKDNNCDNILPAQEMDADDDGYRGCEGDCDDTDEASFPENPEVCDEKDNDCNEVIDDDASDFEPFYQDGDGDGYGSPVTTQDACEVPPGYQINDDDCDDFDPTVYEDALVVCDGIDHDCDGQADYLVADFDADNDGYLSANLCSGLPADYQLDCNDSNNTVNPGATEIPNDDIDNDCDGVQLTEDPGNSPTPALDDPLTSFGPGCTCQAGHTPPPSAGVVALFGLALGWLLRRTLRRPLWVGTVVACSLAPQVHGQTQEPPPNAGWLLFTDQTTVADALDVARRLTITQPSLFDSRVPPASQRATNAALIESLQYLLLEKTPPPGEDLPCPAAPTPPREILKQAAEALDFVETERAAPLLREARTAFACSREPLTPDLWGEFLLLSGVLELYISENQTGKGVPIRHFEQLLAFQPKRPLPKGYPGQVKTAYINATASAKKREAVTVRLGSLKDLPLTLRLNGESISKDSISLLPGPHQLQLQTPEGKIVVSAVVDLKPDDSPVWPNTIFEVASAGSIQARFHALAMGGLQATQNTATEDSVLVSALLSLLKARNAPWLLMISGVKGEVSQSAFLLLPDGRSRQLLLDAAPPDDAERNSSGSRRRADTSASHMHIQALAGINAVYGDAQALAGAFSVGVGRAIGPLEIRLVADLRLQSIPTQYQEVAGGTMRISPAASVLIARPIRWAAVSLTPQLGASFGATPFVELTSERPVLLGQLALAPTAALALARPFQDLPLELCLQLRAQYIVYAVEGDTSSIPGLGDPIRTLIDAQVGLTYRR